jgi:hypothetical protein
LFNRHPFASVPDFLCGRLGNADGGRCAGGMRAANMS